MNDADNRGINELKILLLEMASMNQVLYTGSGIAMANTMYTLFTRHLNYVPTSPSWLNRSRIVLSSPKYSGVA